jgi:hypothetical protein
MVFTFGPLGIFLFVLVVLLLAKAAGNHVGRVMAIFACVMFCGLAVVLLYMLSARTEAQVVSASEAVVATVALPAEAESDGAIPVEAALAEEKAANPPRPAWVDDSKRLVEDDYFVTVMVGPHASREVCDEAMTEELRRATDRYVDQLIGSQGAGELVQLPLADIRRDILQDEYQEIVQASFGPMVNLYGLLKFDRQMQDRIVLEHEQALVQRRVGVAAGGMSLVILVLGTLFGYLKLDTATRGYYSGRLKLAAAAVILSAVTLGAWAAHRSGVDAVLIGERSLAATESRF